MRRCCTVLSRHVPSPYFLSKRSLQSATNHSLLLKNYMIPTVRVDKEIQNVAKNLEKKVGLAPLFYQNAPVVLDFEGTEGMWKTQRKQELAMLNALLGTLGADNIVKLFEEIQKLNLIPVGITYSNDAVVQVFKIHFFLQQTLIISFRTLQNNTEYLLSIPQNKQVDHTNQKMFHIPLFLHPPLLNLTLIYLINNLTKYISAHSWITQSTAKQPLNPSPPVILTTSTHQELKSHKTRTMYSLEMTNLCLNKLIHPILPIIPTASLFLTPISPLLL